MKKLIFVILLLAVIGIGFLHFFTPAHLVLYHDTFRRLSYFPIVLGALWFGVWGGLALAIVASIAFIPHVLIYIGKGPVTYLSELTEIILYLAAGTVTGFIAGREARLKKRYRLLSEKLEKSYDQLHEETALLLEVEEQLSASQKLSALGQLSASLAHEIKNPLSSIKGTAEILLDDFPVDHPKREFVEILLKEADRLNATVEDVLQYSRGGRSGAGNNEVAAESLSRVVDQVVKLLDPHLRKKQVSLLVESKEVGDGFLVDGGKLTQVFLNVIINGIEAVPRGGTIRLLLKKEAEGVSVTICDNGPGVPLADREKIFTPFVSAGKEDGTGLGLPISRKIIESRGGSITVSEAEGGGACFTIYLPFRGSYPASPIMGSPGEAGG